jgi:hypothetical protein
MRAFAHHLTFVRSHSSYFMTALLFTIALLSANVFSGIEIAAAQAGSSVTQKADTPLPASAIDVSSLPGTISWLGDPLRLREVINPACHQKVMLARQDQGRDSGLMCQPAHMRRLAPDGTI